ncbi:MAG: redoxin domain-containing protein [Bacillota bacterium]
MLLRQRHKDLQGLGVQTIGISVDHLPSLKVFDAAMAEFPFPLASDWHRSICRRYDVLDEEKQVARRTLVLCDDRAIVRHVVEDFTPQQHDRFEGLLATARPLS